MLGLRLDTQPAGCTPVSRGACLHTCALEGVHVCFSNDIGVHACLSCLFICGFTLTTSSPHAQVPPLSPLLPFGAPSTVSALRSRCIRGGGFPLLPRHNRKSPTSDMAAATKIGAQQRRLCLSSCLPLPAPCSDKTSHLSTHPHNTVVCHNTSLPHHSSPFAIMAKM